MASDSSFPYVLDNVTTTILDPNRNNTKPIGDIGGSPVTSCHIPEGGRAVS
jgi:hypothetical protein